MTKKVITLVSAVLLIAAAAPVFADSSDWKFSVGSFVENEFNVTDKTPNTLVSPNVNFRAQYKDVYVKVEGENRPVGDMFRQKAMLGTSFNFGALAFNPEYEFRMTSAMEDIYGDEDASIENRFKLNFGLNLGAHRPYLNTMPTLKISGDDSNYYHEIELGYRYMISGKQNVALGVYNELNMNTDDTLHNELQARLYYSYTFDNGINVSPFARIGLYRTRSDVQDERRDRVGTKVSYSASNGLAPFAEAWWQGVDAESGYTNHMMVKMGMTYSW